MDKLIDEVILKAIDRYKHDNSINSNYKLAIEWDVPQSTIGRWINKKTRTIKHSLWIRIEPLLTPYIIEVENQSGIIPSIEEGQIIQEISGGVDDLFITVTRLSREVIRLRTILSNVSDLVTGKNPATPKALPYIKQKVAAGVGCEISDETYQDRIDMHYMDINGESMEPTYYDNQKVIVQLFQQRVVFGDLYLSIEMVKNMIPEDSVIVYNLNGSGLAMKRVKYQKNKNSWYFILHADNNQWADVNDFPLFIRKGDDFEIFGIVVGAE